MDTNMPTILKKTTTGAVPLLFMLFAVRTTLAQTIVTGVVRDSSGAAVAHAFVEAVPRMSDRGRGTIGDSLNPWTPADEHGKFRINLSPGRYKIRAKDEADGYPDPLYWLNPDPTAAFPEIVVALRDISDIRVVLGSRGATLEGEVRDPTGAPVRKAKVTISDADQPQAYVEVFTNDMGQFHFTVPAKPIAIQATATGYVSSNLDGGERVTLSSGERRQVEIELEPVSTK